MRTTVSINDNLLERAKAEARNGDQTLGQFVEDAIRVYLAERRRRGDAPVPPIPVLPGKGGMNPAIDPTSNAALQAFLDDGLPLEKLR